jgi:hypothetical protein
VGIILAGSSVVFSISVGKVTSFVGVVVVRVFSGGVFTSGNFTES